ncbi:YggT family protein [Clostridium psychrophilum]|uniref:YggT family protein n=1 Tax=Clostridium psychrophilum TaxID=132926 RepID=UPI001C0B3CD1|nr:YggT family protein [Clostridium psychrophilum]MBU3181864.1 YggT family protein [Clostridium psychrophilum]
MIRLINIIFNVFYYAIIIEVILSWVYSNRTNQYIELLHKVTNPLLQPCRKIQDRIFNNMMIDFSPMIALFILMILKQIVFSVLGILGL